MSTSRSFVRKTLASKWVLGLAGAVLVVGGVWFFTHRGGSTYQFVTVAKGSVKQTVSVTGNTVPMRNVSLGFQTSGTITQVYGTLGGPVRAGAVIAQTNAASLSAALQQAQANVDAQQAQLAGLQAGAQPADIAASQATLAQAQQNLANIYAGISDAAASGYAKANDAVRTQISTFFSNAETNQPQLTFNTADSQSAVNATALRVSASVELNAWQQELSAIAPSSSPDTLRTALAKSVAHLAVVQRLLAAASGAVNANINLSATQLATDKTAITTGVTEVNAAISALNTISQNIASQQTVVAQAQAELALKQAGSTSQAIAAQQALVEQAKAGVASALANLQNTEIVAPISGVLTQLDAKVGQQATPGTPLVSIIGNGGFEVDAGVSEIDVGKLKIGDTVDMTLDAFPNETFTGSVFYIAPSQTNTQGVITYLVKISFDTPDPRLKSGLTANLNIETSHKDNVLVLPQYAILQTDKGTFVEVLKNKAVTQVPVTLGIQDQQGNVEVTSGVTEGEQVLNIGLKAK